MVNRVVDRVIYGRKVGMGNPRRTYLRTVGSATPVLYLSCLVGKIHAILLYIAHSIIETQNEATFFSGTLLVW